MKNWLLITVLVCNGVSYARSMPQGLGGGRLDASNEAMQRLAAAGLAYLKAESRQDICAQTALAYLNKFVDKASLDEAYKAAKNTYMTVHKTSGNKPTMDKACEEAAKAFQQGEASGVDDAVTKAAMAFVKNHNNFLQGDACAAAAGAYMDKFAAGVSDTDARLAAIGAFTRSYKTDSGKETDAMKLSAACTAAARAYINTDNSPLAVASLAFLDKAEAAGGNVHDPICLSALNAFVDEFKSSRIGSRALLASAKSMLTAYANGALVSVQSPCLGASQAFSSHITVTSSAPFKSAMTAFISRMTQQPTTTGAVKPDPACAAAALAYLESHLSNHGQGISMVKAGQSFLSSYTKGINLPADSACLTAYKGYIKTLSAQTSLTSAMTAVLDALTAKGDDKMSSANDASSLPNIDSVCIAGASAYMNAALAGDSDLRALLKGAQAYFAAFELANAGGKTVSSNSPCTAGAAKYLATMSDDQLPSKSAARGMAAFMKIAVNTSELKLDTVCLKAAKAYIDGYLEGKSEMAATKKAAVAFANAVKSDKKFNFGSPCGMAASAFMDADEEELFA